MIGLIIIASLLVAGAHENVSTAVNQFKLCRDLKKRHDTLLYRLAKTRGKLSIERQKLEHCKKQLNTKPTPIPEPDIGYPEAPMGDYSLPPTD